MAAVIRRYEINDEEWERIKPYIPEEQERHLVECFFNKLKENRRIDTRFDKLASRFLAFVHLGCIRIQLT